MMRFKKSLMISKISLENKNTEINSSEDGDLLLFILLFFLLILPFWSLQTNRTDQNHEDHRFTACMLKVCWGFSWIFKKLSDAKFNNFSHILNKLPRFRFDPRPQNNFSSFSKSVSLRKNVFQVCDQQLLTRKRRVWWMMNSLVKSIMSWFMAWNMEGARTTARLWADILLTWENTWTLRQSGRS